MAERRLGKDGVTCGGLLAVLRAFLTVGDGSGSDNSSARHSSERRQKCTVPTLIGPLAGRA